MRALPTLLVSVTALWLAAGGCSSSSSGGADAGATCTTCFVHGQWALANLSPCIVSRPGDGGAAVVTGAVSTHIENGVAACPSDTTSVPSQPWSSSTLTVDCPGHYRLCVTFKAGSAASPKSDDCVMATTCAEGDHPGGGQTQAFTPLPGWAAQGAAAIACAGAFSDSGGYAELGVVGTATGCGVVGRVFQRVNYCPLSCNLDPGAPACANCGAGSTGKF